MNNKFALALLAAGLATSTFTTHAAAQAKSAATTAAAEVPSGYNVPPQAILDVMRAPAPPQPVVSPTNDRIPTAAL